MPPVIPQVENKVDIIHIVEPHLEEHRYERTHTIILLHGRGQTAEDFANDFFDTMYEHLDKCVTELFPSFKWVFPSARQLPAVALQDECEQKFILQWFDMQSTKDPRKGEKYQQSEFDASVSYIQSIVKTEAAILGDMERGYPRIVLGGFDQGCAVAMQALLNRNTKELAGFIGLNGRMRLPNPLDSIDDNNEVLQTFAHTSHNKNDCFIDIEYGREMSGALDKRMKQIYNSHVEYEEGGHWITEAEAHRLMFFLDLCTYCEDIENLNMGFETCKKCDNWWKRSEAHDRDRCPIWLRLPRQHW